MKLTNEEIIYIVISAVILTVICWNIYLNLDKVKDPVKVDIAETEYICKTAVCISR